MFYCTCDRSLRRKSVWKSVGCRVFTLTDGRRACAMYSTAGQSGVSDAALVTGLRVYQSLS